MEREELIDRYIQGMLTTSEKEDFDSLVATDADFREEVEIIKNLHLVAGAEDRENLKKTMAHFEAKIADKETPVVALFTYKKFLIAASIALFIGIGIYSLLTPFGSDTNELYAAHFEPYRNVVTPIVRGENDRDKEVIAFIAYENKEYTTAANQFARLYEETQKSYFLLYQANALLAADKAQVAIPILEQHLKLNDSFKEKSMWYLALAHLKSNNTNASIDLLKELAVKKAAFKKEEAAVLLKELE